MLERVLEQLNQLVDKIVLLMDRFPDNFWDRGLETLESGTAGLLDTLAMLKELVASIVATLEFMRWSGNVFLDWACHFVYSACLGLLAYWVISSVTRWALGSVMFRSRSKISWQGVLEPAMWRLAFSSGLFVSWLAHLWWDRPLF